MFKLKSLRKEGVPGALERAERYRLLNEPFQAESICLDILEVESTHQRALITLLLARTDQFLFGKGSPEAAGEVLPRIEDPYQRVYYAGIISERRGWAALVHARPGGDAMASEYLHRAMEQYAEAEVLSPSDNDDSRLRWNTCARILSSTSRLRPKEGEREQPLLLE